MRSLVTVAAFCCAALAAPAVASVVAELPYRVGADARVATDVFVNGQGPFRFLLDTAASRSMMFEHLRARLGLGGTGGEPLTVYGMQNVGTALPVKAEEVRLSSETIRNLAMGVLPDESDPADGLLGMDALSNYLVVLDRKGMRLKLLTPGDGEAAEFRSWPSLSLTRRPVKDAAASLWLMRASVGGTSVTSLLDMGSGMTILNWNAAEQMGLKRTSFPKDGIPQKLRDALGTVEPVVFVKGLTIWLGGRVFTDQTVLIANVNVFRYFHLDGAPAGIIGSGLLKDNSLAIDFQRQLLYVGPPVAEERYGAGPTPVAIAPGQVK
ncbi:MAG TPA: aspartyl protease family protein [Rhizomicrobium sp.]|nr:aspartyl protease family protein [Rhizomicrobium sp.]